MGLSQDRKEWDKNRKHFLPSRMIDSFDFEVNISKKSTKRIEFLAVFAAPIAPYLLRFKNLSQMQIAETKIVDCVVEMAPNKRMANDDALAGDQRKTKFLNDSRFNLFMLFIR